MVVVAVPGEAHDLPFRALVPRLQEILPFQFLQRYLDTENIAPHAAYRQSDLFVDITGVVCVLEHQRLRFVITRLEIQGVCLCLALLPGKIVPRESRAHMPGNALRNDAVSRLLAPAY